MVDVAISYDSANRVHAISVKDNLRTHGLNVWIDDSDETNPSKIGVAPGSYHQNEIATNFLTAGVVLILDTQRWRQQPYCKWEYDLVRKAGKRVAIIPCDTDYLDDTLNCAPIATFPIKSIEDLIKEIPLSKRISAAHSRLTKIWYDSLTDEDMQEIGFKGSNVIDENSSVWEKCVPTKISKKYSHDPLIVDAANTVINHKDPQNSIGITLSNPLLNLATSICDFKKRRSKLKMLLTWAGMSLIYIFFVLAIIFCAQAVFSKEKTKSELAKQQSLFLAAQSNNLENSYDRLETAKTAIEISKTDIAKSSNQSAVVSNKILSTFSVPQTRYLGAIISEDKKQLVLIDRNGVFVVSLADGKLINHVTVDDEIGSRLIGCTKNASHVVIATTNGVLVDVDVSAGNVSKIPANNASSFFVDENDDLWLCTMEGEIIRRNIPWSDPNNDSIYASKQEATAIAVSKFGKELALINKKGELVLYNINDTLEEKACVSAFDSSVAYTIPLGKESSLDADALIPSGENYICLRKRRVVLFEAINKTIVASDALIPDSFGSKIIPASLGGNAVTYQGWLSFEQIVPSDAPNPLSFLGRSTRVGGNMLAGTRDGTLLAIVHLDASIELLHLNNSPLEVGLVKGSIPLILDGEVHTLDFDGTIYDNEGNIDLKTNNSIPVQQPVFSENNNYYIDNDNNVVCINNKKEIVTFPVNGLDKNASLWLGNTISDNIVSVYGLSCYGIGEIGKNDINMVSPNFLSNDEKIIMSATNSDGTKIALKTSTNNLYLINRVSGQVLTKAYFLMPSYRSGITFNSDDSLFIEGLGGKILILDENLVEKQIRIFSSNTIGAVPLQGGKTALLKLGTGDFEIISLDTLQTIQQIIVPKNYMASFISVNEDSTILWLVCVNTNGAATLFKYPIFLP